MITRDQEVAAAKHVHSQQHAVAECRLQSVHENAEVHNDGVAVRQGLLFEVSWKEAQPNPEFWNEHLAIGGTNQALASTHYA